MPNWTGVVMTRKGKKLQLKAIAGAPLVFTRLKLGDGQLQKDQHVEALTDLISPKQILTISECKVTDEELCEISSVISNSGLQSPYFARELGIFATDPDEGEILYAISRDETPDYIPEDGGSVPTSHNFKVYINVGNISDVSGQIDVGGWATSGFVVEQIGNHDKDPNAHYDMTGATNTVPGKRGFVPAPGAGAERKYLRGDGLWETPTDTTYKTMTGASQYAAGTTGLTPAPSAGDNNKYLRGDGKWADPAYPPIMKGAGSSLAGTQGLAPAPGAGDNGKFLRGDGKWADPAYPPTMTGATANAAGKAGLVPAPSVGANGKYLRGDGQWGTPAYPPDMTGATAAAAGKAGLVPASKAGDQGKFLCADGAWKSIIDLLFPIGRIIMSMDATNPGTLYPGTTWQRIGQGRTIIDCGGDYKAGTPGGAATVTLTEVQIPKHTHTGSTASAGAHTHTRGTMNITGRTSVSNDLCGYGEGPHTGAFYYGGEDSTYRYANDRDGGSVCKVMFDASRSWTGSTSSAGTHTHAVTINSTGGGGAHNNMPPYMPAYIWQRTA